MSKFLGKGLVTTEVSKWHSQRKLLTPAFHFNILERYIPVFCEKTRILIVKLEAEISANPEGINIVPYITRCALDIICETAMGHAVNAQEGATSEYLSTIHKIEQLIYYRIKRRRKKISFLDLLLNVAAKDPTLTEFDIRSEVDTFMFAGHDTTTYAMSWALYYLSANPEIQVLQKRRNEMKTAPMEDTVTETDDDFGRRKKISFLDLLLNVAAKDPTLTEFDIRSEVDTFMFAGHDTTTYGMSWTVYYLSTNPEIQDHCLTELEEIFGTSDRDPTMTDLANMKYIERDHCLTELEEIFGTSDRDPTMTDLANMKYIERVIKETMRLRPPAWIIGRKLTKSLKFDGYDAFPPNTVIQINIAGIHRNPEIYPDPEKFDPDRFLPENCVGRHPFAYIPFSAGPRNCIGQRFAMLEMKVVISTLLRHFKLESCDPEFYNEAIPRLTLQPMNGVKTILSSSEKWHSRRKLLTPAFHFSILEQFVPVICDKTRILVEKLRVAAAANPDGFNIVPFVTLCALDIICETAMGTTVNAQEKSDSLYVTSIYQRPWLWPDWIFKLSSPGRKFEKCRKVLHAFTDKVIRERREEMKHLEMENNTDDDDGSGPYKKKKTAFLELLLNGHDTTAMGLSWTLHFLSVHQDVQSCCVEELDEIFCGSDRDVKMADLSKMKYLERVIKESMRLRPPVRNIGRKLHKSIKFDGYEEFPAKTVITIGIHQNHHNPDYFPDPEKFDPDRFLPENCVGRHPFAYIPFSAGPRNCIGQKFAMMELKSTLSYVLRQFRLESCDPEFYSQEYNDLVLRPLNGIKTRLYTR
ncbi:hypothetical protein B566_EDAN002837 [Ephemera danica]|nr:hypothetical protein B566_EDAN002837 [Ephemera danica]